MASKYPPSSTDKDLGDLAKMAKAAAAKRPKPKPKPFNQQEADRESKLNKQYTARASKNQAFAGSNTEPYNVGPMKPKTKPKTKTKGPQSEGARPMWHNMQKMPKQTGPKKTSKMRKY